MSALQQALYAYGRPPASGDPFFANVRTLLHFDGSDGSSTFTDVKGLPYTAVGTARIKTAQFKFGTASLSNGGSGTPYISTTSVATLALSNLTFTLEMWVYVPSAITTPVGLVFYVTGGGFQLSITAANVVEIVNRGNGTVLTASTAFPRNQWVHLAITRNGTTFTIWQDGVSAGTASYAPAFSVGGEFQIGAVNNSGWYLLNGYIDEFRLTIGTARYTSTFTPPAAAFPNS